jgi:hypothetical protein
MSSLVCDARVSEIAMHAMPDEQGPVRRVWVSLPYTKNGKEKMLAIVVGLGDCIVTSDVCYGHNGKILKVSPELKTKVFLAGVSYV